MGARWGGQHANKCQLELLCKPRSLKLFSVARIPQHLNQFKRSWEVTSWSRGGVEGQLLASLWNPLRQGHRPGWQSLLSRRMWIWPTAMAFSIGTTGLIGHNKALSSDDWEPSRCSNGGIRSKEPVWVYKTNRFLMILNAVQAETIRWCCSCCIPVWGREKRWIFHAWQNKRKNTCSFACFN